MTSDDDGANLEAASTTDLTSDAHTVWSFGWPASTTNIRSVTTGASALPVTYGTVRNSAVSSSGVNRQNQDDPQTSNLCCPRDLLMRGERNAVISHRPVWRSPSMRNEERAMSDLAQVRERARQCPFARGLGVGGGW